MTLQGDRFAMEDAYFFDERRLIELGHTIPFNNADETFSPTLYDILQSSCSQVSNIMRILCEYFELDVERKNFPSYYNVLNEDHVLEKQAVDCSFKNNIVYTPFVLRNNEEVPFWWTKYNDTKHDLPQGYVEGNLINTFHAMSASYALNCMMYYANRTPRPDNFFNNTSWMIRDSLSTRRKEFVRLALDERPFSKNFYCLTYYLGEGAPI